MGKRITFILITILFFGISAGVQSTSAQSGVTMAAQAAFDGNFKFGEWLPIYVTMENNGANLSGELQATISGNSGELEFVVPVELSTGSRKRFTLYVQPNSFSRSMAVHYVPDEAEEPLLSQEVELTRVFNDHYVLGVIAAEPASLEAWSVIQLSGRRDRIQVISMPLDDLPDRAEGLDLFDAMVLNDVDTSGLSPNQQAALQSWVTTGGRLIIGGGAGTERTLAGLPDELRLVSVVDQVEFETLPTLASYGNAEIRVSGPFLITQVQPKSDIPVLLFETESATSSFMLPLVTEQAMGTGYVNYVAMDLTQSPFDAWAGAIMFAENLLSPGAAWPEFLPPDIAPEQARDSQMTYALSNLPSLDLPSIQILSILLIIYIILVGPVNYLILRWRDRLAWAWVTIPVLTLSFAGVAYGIGFSQRGSDVIINQISLLEMEQGGKVSQGRTYVGVFSPSRQAYDVEIAGRSLIRPLGEGYDPWSGQVNTNAMTVVQGEPSRVRGLAINQWSLQSFVAETVLEETPGLTADLQTTRESISGKLTNQGSQTWQDVMVLHNGQVEKIGDLAPNQSADINLVFNQGQFFEHRYGSWWIFEEQFNRNGPPQREVIFKQNVLDSVLFNYGQVETFDGPILIAWLNDSPLQISLADSRAASQKTSLLYGSLPLSFVDSEVAIPPGFGRAETLSISGQSGTCGPSGYHVYQGSVELRLALPETIHGVQPEVLDLYMLTDGGQPVLPQVELYDYASEDWVTFNNVVHGVNLIQDADRFYQTDKASMDIRITSDNNFGGGCFYFDMAIEGKRL